MQIRSFLRPTPLALGYLLERAFMEYAQLTPGRGFLPMQSFLYYGQRFVTSLTLRRLAVKAIKAGIRFRQGTFSVNYSKTTCDNEILKALDYDGYAPLPVLLSTDKIQDIRTFLRDKLLTSRHNCETQFTIDRAPKEVLVADYNLKDIIEAPYILELANSPFLLHLATSHLGCKPTISALGLRWSFPSMLEGTDVQAFHRDSDDWRYIKVLVYLTDVDEEAGPHVYVRESHRTKAPMRLRLYKDAEIIERHGTDSIILATGSAGFGFVVDTSGIHKGAVPFKKPRLMLQIQYSLLPAFTYRYRPQPYTGSLSLDPYINRLFCVKAI